MFKIVFRDSSLYPKHLHIFYNMFSEKNTTYNTKKNTTCFSKNEYDMFSKRIRHITTPTTLDQTPSDYAGLVVVAVFKISSKYVRIIRSLATRRTLGIPKLLKCINKAQPESERSGAMLWKNTAPELEPCLRKQRAPEPVPSRFYKSSAALLSTTVKFCMRCTFKAAVFLKKIINIWDWIYQPL